MSEDEIDMYELTEADGDLQIVTECWVEPQYGVVVNSSPERQHWEGLTYKQIARAVSRPRVCNVYRVSEDIFGVNFFIYNFLFDLLILLVLVHAFTLTQPKIIIIMGLVIMYVSV